MNSLYELLSYNFKDENLCMTAFMHSSYANEMGLKSNERLEFLGDVIVEFIVRKELFDMFPQLNEGVLSKYKANIVNKESLASAIDASGLFDYIKLGGSVHKNSAQEFINIKADLFESIVGAMYLDGGMEPCKTFVNNMLDFDKLINKKDYKTELQELTQKFGKDIPFYNTQVKNSRAVSFVIVDGNILGEGMGLNKKTAEKEAAREALAKLMGNIEIQVTIND